MWYRSWGQVNEEDSLSLSHILTKDVPYAFQYYADDVLRRRKRKE